jgi:predicted transposase YdaD
LTLIFLTLKSGKTARREGREEGHETGRVQGFVESARRMKAAGLAAADIALFTGLKPEEIAGL